MRTASSPADPAPATAGSVLDAAAALLAQPIEGDLAQRCSRLEEVHALLAGALQPPPDPPGSPHPPGPPHPPGEP